MPVAKAKDSPSESRSSRGLGQESSRPRTKDTGANVFRKKRSSKFFFRQSPKKEVFKIFFQANYRILTIQKIVQSSIRKQGNFQELEASRLRRRTSPSRPRAKPRTSKCVLEDFLEATDVLEDSASANR